LAFVASFGDLGSSLEVTGSVHRRVHGSIFHLGRSRKLVSREVEGGTFGTHHDILANNLDAFILGGIFDDLGTLGSLKERRVRMVH
jgi:hypothetical protein